MDEKGKNGLPETGDHLRRPLVRSPSAIWVKWTNLSNVWAVSGLDLLICMIYRGFAPQNSPIGSKGGGFELCRGQAGRNRGSCRDLAVEKNEEKMKLKFDFYFERFRGLQGPE